MAGNDRVPLLNVPGKEHNKSVAVRQDYISSPTNACVAFSGDKENKFRLSLRMKVIFLVKEQKKKLVV